MLLASLLVALVLGGCKAGYQNFPFSLNGPAFLLFYGVEVSRIIRAGYRPRRARWHQTA
jgi:hypothetical protein